MSGDVALAAGDWSLTLSPERGGALVGAVWRGMTVTRALDPAVAAGGPVGALGGFVMLPWCNRIDRGRFPWGDGVVQVPVNRPETDVAIHGFGRERPWTVAAADAAGAVLTQAGAEPGSGFAWSARQDWRIVGDSVEASLTVANAGDAPRPFGLGFHPYFHATPASRVSFRAAGAATLDARQLPAEWAPDPGPDAAAIADLADMDRPFAGWDGTARLVWPERGLALTLEAGPELPVLHVYAPRGAGFVCLEPCTHLPNAHNRPDLAAHAPLTVLEPGAALSGRMRWRIAPTG